jgi:hypothetical protein
VKVRRINFSGSHAYAAHLKAVGFAQVHGLIETLRDSRTDKRIIFFGAAFRQTKINECLGAIAQARKRNKTVLKAHKSKTPRNFFPISNS